MTEILMTIVLAVVLDWLVPDRHGFKPFAWFRDWAESIEERFNGGKRIHGVGALLLATVPIVAMVEGRQRRIIAAGSRFTLTRRCVSLTARTISSLSPMIRITLGDARGGRLSQ